MFARLGKGRGRALAASALLVLAVACGGDEPADNGLPEPPPGTPEPPTALRITATDFRFDLSVAKVPAGLVEVELRNEGRAPHQVQILRPKLGVSLAKLERTVKSDRDGRATLEIATLAGGPGGLSGVEGGDSQSATVALGAGKHLVVCLVDGHVARGMIARLTVTPEPGPAAVLDPIRGQLSLNEYEIKVRQGFNGKGVIQVLNRGDEAHEVSIFRVDAKLGEVEQFIDAGLSGRPPGGGEPQPVGGASGFSGRSSQFIELDLEPGVYAFLCFMPDKSGRAHAERGMATAVEVE